ncbi:MAG: aminoacyl-tRNA hydrolase [Ruminococcus flavefaciens]|nr:aminoacyl-tRNA hydrolase [Ruminococcus flavefaciens]MCM1362988.1 aminoacyl-tRNA hydrolase [Clostridiales bacterium]MCM1435770.1 aminoacyl-tRNA hydrolase [Ruminococcus flavefaciens]
MSIFDIFDRIYSDSSRTGGKIEYIIAGLGNPGMEYDNTRHNAGFNVLDTLASQLGENINRLKFKGKTAEASIGGKRCLLLKPTTYMNNSGESIVQAMEFYKIDIAHVIVVCDDISLDTGKLRIRRKGSHGGHNGLRSICELTGSDDFSRIKIGVGKKPHPDYDLAKWVLGKFGKEDAERMKESAENACECIKLMVQDKTDEAMNKYNS